MKRKIKIIIEYEGTDYHGWQVQPNGITIQEVLQETLQTILKKKTSVIGSGRTDSGVHAEGQVAHFVTDSSMTQQQLLKAMNSLLPSDIIIKSVEEVSMDFHAQKSAVRKTYRYTILSRDHPSALFFRRSWYTPFSLDLWAMRRAKTFLIGKHDYSSFRASNCEAKSPVREVHKIIISQENDFIMMWFEGNGFLKHMVRNIVGTLIQVGRKKMSPKRVQEILELRDRKQAGPTAKARGLCLVKVDYGKKKSFKPGRL